MSIFIGCDLGGTNIKAGLVDISSGDVLLSQSVPTQGQEGPEFVLKRMSDLIGNLVKDSEFNNDAIQGLGVSAPGLLDFEKGETKFLPNFPGQWRGVPLRDTLQDHLNMPVSMLNDVRAITYGEYSFGAGRGVDRMACFAIGTGIGGGLVIGGKLLLGFDGTAGELGHQTMDLHGPRCGCGNYGCLEAFASGPAIASMGEKAVRQGLTTKIAELVDYNLNEITPKIIAQAAQRGDEIAQEIWDTAGHYLGTAAANICVTVGPECIVLAGGVSSAGNLLLDPVKEAIEDRVFVMPKERVNVVLSSLGSDAGILGIAKWASEHQN